MRRLTVRLLVIALIFTACGDCEDQTAQPWDVSASDDTGPSGRPHFGDAGGDTANLPDSDPPDGASDPCENAAAGAACTKEGVSCNYTCDGACGFCSGLECYQGIWISYEDAPPRFCERRCHPVTDPCKDATYSSCQYVDDIDDFRCFEPGDGKIGDECDPEIAFENGIACEDDLHCVTIEAGTNQCVRLCDPVAQDPGECPYGCKPASDFGIGDPDLGFCIVPRGNTCVDASPPPAGSCDLFLQDCSGDQICDVVVVLDSQSNPTFQTSCVTDDGRHTQGEKEYCSAPEDIRCAAGLACYEVSNSCTFFCRLADGFGCTAGQSCRDEYPGESGLGLCANECG